MMAPARAARPMRAQNRERRAGRDSAGAGHDDDRDGRANVVGHQVGEHRRAEREIDQIARQAVRQALHRGARALGLLDRLDDLAVARIAADPLGADFQRPGLVDGARQRRGARPSSRPAATRR